MIVNHVRDRVEIWVQIAIAASRHTVRISISISVAISIRIPVRVPIGISVPVPVRIPISDTVRIAVQRQQASLFHICMRHQVAENRIAIRIKSDQQLVEVERLPPERSRVWERRCINIAWDGSEVEGFTSTGDRRAGGRIVGIFRSQQRPNLRPNGVRGGEQSASERRREEPAGGQDRWHDGGWHPLGCLCIDPCDHAARHVRQFAEIPAVGCEPTQRFGSGVGVDEVERSQRGQPGSGSDSLVVGS